MPTPKVKFHTLKIFLIKEGLQIADILSTTPLSVDNHDTIDSIEQDIIIDISEFIGSDYRYKLVLKKPAKKAPAWSDFFPLTIKEQFISKLFTASAAAVLLVQSNPRTYAIVLGRGRYMLNQDAYERDFGLKVVLNTIDPDKIRSLDTDSLDDFIFHETKQSSKATSFDSYELQPLQDMLKGVAGNPKKTAFKFDVRFIAGSDVLAINAGIKINKLGKLCTNIYEKYSSVGYKKRFEFIDNLRIVKDTDEITALNAKLVKKLIEEKRNPSIEDSLIVAPPDTIDFKDIEGICFYSIYNSNRDAYEDKIEVEISEWLLSLPSETDITIERLKQEKIAVKIDSVYTPKWNIYNCISYEATNNNKQYILSNGLWYSVKNSLIEDVDIKIVGIQETVISLLDSTKGEHEGAYNERVFATDPNNYILMDKKNIKTDNSVIEFCDLIFDSTPLHFIHVKRKTQSATLSHLFAQGRISGTLFKRSQDFRLNVSKKISKAKVKRLIIPTSALNMSNYKIVFAIITKPNLNWPKSLPFFSKLNLKNTAEELEMLGYKVTLLRINQLLT